MDYYIGLDAHSKTCTFVALDKDAEVVRDGKFKTSEGGLVSMVKSLEGRVSVVLEETNIAHWIYTILREVASEVIVCHAAHLPRKSGAKTDYRDAVHLAKQLRAGNLTPVYHGGDDEIMSLRAVVSNYQDVVNAMTEQKNRLKALLRSEGVAAPKTKLLSRCEIRLSRPSAKEIVIKRIQEQLLSLESIKKKYFDDFHSNRYRIKHINNLRSIPGIGPVRAHVLAAYIATGHRFQTKHHLWAYSNLVRHHDSSDGVIVSKRRAQGRSELKNVFMGAALKVIVSPVENSLKQYYRYLISQKHLDERKARKALARKIAAVCLVILKKEVRYNDRLVKDAIGA